MWTTPTVASSIVRRQELRMAGNLAAAEVLLGASCPFAIFLLKFLAMGLSLFLNLSV